jgi:hypothetical protein
VARPKSKAPDDNLDNDNLNLLNFVVVGSEIACRMNSRLQICWPDLTVVVEEEGLGTDDSQEKNWELLAIPFFS